MKEAIEYIRTYGVKVSDTGFIEDADLPEGENGLIFVDGLEDATGYTIIGNQVTKYEY